MTVGVVAALATGTSSAAQSTAPSPTPATTPVVATHERVGRGDADPLLAGRRVPTPYRWLEELTAPATRRWLAAQDERTARWFDAADPGGRTRAGLRTQLAALLDPAPRVDVPVYVGGRYYAVRTGAEHPVLVASRTPAGPTRVVLDGAAVARAAPASRGAEAGPAALVTDFLHVAPDGRHLAYGVTRGGSEWQRLRVRDLRTGRDLPDVVDGLRTWTWATWTADGAGFVYARELPPAAGGPAGAKGADQLLYHQLGSAQAQDRIVVDLSREPSLVVRQYPTPDRRHLVLLTGRGNEPRRQLAVLDLRDPRRLGRAAAPRPLGDSTGALYALAGSVGRTLYLATTAGAPRGRVVAIDLADPRAADPTRWRTLVPEGPGTEVLDVDPHVPSTLVVGRRLVVRTGDGFRQTVRVYPLDGPRVGRPERTLALPAGARVGALRGTPERPELLFTVGRFPAPPALWRANVATGALAAVRTPTSALDARQYETRLVEFTAPDGARNPMYVTHRRGLDPDGARPTLLVAYGGFGGGVGPGGYGPPFVRAVALAWLARGGVLASASLRGDATFGEAWHAAAMGVHKQRTFDDVIAAAEHLVRAGYTRPARLAFFGSSNGGLTAAALLTQRPDLVAAVVPDVPLTDMVRYAALPGGDIATSEYGVPDTPERLQALLAYSPLHHVTGDAAPGLDAPAATVAAARPVPCYPATLLTTGRDDENVHPSHAYKLAAALQAAHARAACAAPVLLRAEADAGHGGGVGRAAQLAKAADVVVFLARALDAPLRARASAPGARVAAPRR